MGWGVATIPRQKTQPWLETSSSFSIVAAMQGTFFVHAGDKGFHIGPGVPTNVPVSEIRAVGYDGPRTIEEESVADLKKWFEDRLEDGFKFDLLDGVDGT
jgi:hypothetical protein